MKALDSNIVLRLLLGDDPIQSPVAEAYVRESCWVSLTVLLEVAWVLASRYGLTRHETVGVLRGLAGYDSLRIEGREAALWAIDRYERGGDIADLLHVAAAREAQAFATFDRAIAAAAGNDAPVPVETLA